MFKRTLFGIFLVSAMWLSATPTEAQTASSDASLSSLVLSEGVVLSPAFDSDTLSYTVNVRSSRDNLDITPTATDGNLATVAVGRTLMSLSAVGTGATVTPSITKTSGTAAQDATANTFIIFVVAEDGTTRKTYQIAVSRLAARTDATLSALELPAGATLSSAFASDTESYTADIRNSLSSLTITPTATDADEASIQVGRSGSLVAVDSGSESIQSITRTSGTAAQDAAANTFLIVITAEDGSTTKTYQVAVSRLMASADATLSALELTAGAALSPAFASDTESYTTDVRNSWDNLGITPTATDAIGASIQVGRSGSLVAVDSGSESSQSITKTSGGGAQDASMNTFVVVITAEDGTTTKTYQVAASRVALRTDATLSALELTAGVELSPAFASDTVSYTTDIRSGRRTLGITPTATDAVGARIQVGRLNDTVITTASGSESIQRIRRQLPISDAQNASANTFVVVVTAEDGTTSRTYQIAVSRLALGTDATLSALELTAGAALSPVFVSDTESYTTDVRSSWDNLAITPTATDAGGASIQVGRSGSLAAVDSGSASSQSITKTSGTAAQDASMNTFLVVVTAEDGTTTKTYQVAASRLALGTDATLSALELTAGAALSPSFVSATESYTTDVRSSWDNLAITPTATDAVGASIQVGRSGSLTAVGSGSASSQSITKTSGTAAQDATMNTFLVVVTAEDGTTTKTYQVAASRLALRTDATLSALELTTGAALSPVFVSDTESYTTDVRSSWDNLAITPTATDAGGASIQVGRSGSLAAVDSGSASSQSITKTSGTAAQDASMNTFLVVVTAEDGTTTKTYQVAASRLALGTDATLSALELTTGAALSPVFVSDTESYTTDVRSSWDNLSITPTATDAVGASIQVGRSGSLTAVDSGSASSQSITKTSGTAAQDATMNTFLVVVTAEDGTTTKTYQVAASRLAVGADATLSALELTAGATLSPVFVSDTESYTTDVRSSWDNLSITPTATDAVGASIQVGRSGSLTAVDSGSASSQSITKTSGTAAQDATANTFLVVVTAEDGTTTKTYQVAASRLAVGADATLSALELPAGATLSPAFVSSTESYAADARNSWDNLAITPTATDSIGASIQVGRSGSLTAVDSGTASSQSITKTSGTAAQDATANTFLVVVTAEDGTTTKTYQLAVSRLAASSDATLSALELPAGATLSPAFVSSTESYTADIWSSLRTLAITPTATDSIGASIQVGRSGSLTAVDSGTASSQSITETSGTAAQDATANTFLVVVTAEDGTTTKTYQLAVSRLAISADATLSGLTITGGGTLSPAFSSGTTAYDFSVPADVEGVTFTPTATQPGGTVITVGRDGSPGSNLGSGDTSANQLIQVGGGAGSTTNVFLVIVTAEDGTTTSTYTVNIFRASPITKILVHDSSLSAGARTDANSLLSTAAVSGGATAFDPAIQAYSLRVPAAVGGVVITPTFGSGTVEYQRTQPGATTTLTAIASDAASASVSLSDGVNVIVIKFSASGATANYTITIARFSLDVDGGGAAASDGVLVARYLLSLRGDPLLSGQSRVAAATVEAAVKVGVDEQFLNVGINDAILIPRYMLGVRGGGLTTGLSGLDATEEAMKISDLLPAP